MHHPMIAAMPSQCWCRTEIPAAVRHYGRAIAEFPTHWQLPTIPEVLLRSKSLNDALTSLEKRSHKRPDDDAAPGARGAASGRTGYKDAAAPLRLSEQYASRTICAALIDQFELASKAGDGDY